MGYKKNSKRKDQMVYSRVDINLRDHSRAVIENVELGKWVEGGVILEKVGTKGYSVTGIVSSTSKCEKRQPEVRMISDEILGMMRYDGEIKHGEQNFLGTSCSQFARERVLPKNWLASFLREVKGIKARFNLISQCLL